eukprot:scaffold15511_cov135-Isochrysis_galbana.AAC.6
MLIRPAPSATTKPAARVMPPMDVSHKRVPSTSSAPTSMSESSTHVSPAGMVQMPVAEPHGPPRARTALHSCWPLASRRAPVRDKVRDAAGDSAAVKFTASA